MFIQFHDRNQILIAIEKQYFNFFASLSFFELRQQCPV